MNVMWQAQVIYYTQPIIIYLPLKIDQVHYTIVLQKSNQMTVM